MTTSRPQFSDPARPDARAGTRARTSTDSPADTRPRTSTDTSTDNGADSRARSGAGTRAGSGAGSGGRPSALPLAAYREAVALDEPFRPSAAPARADRLDLHVRTALRLLGTDRAVSRRGLPPGSLRDLRHADAVTARRLLRAVLTVRPPGPLPEGAEEAVDRVLGAERLLRPGVRVDQLPTIAEEFPGTAFPAARRTTLWRGDITALAADAVVNAANSALLGCFQPLHACIDNAVHHAAGPRLRDDCHSLVTLQGDAEPTGGAKITRGYHLPARHVLHTVGPIIDGRPGAGDARALASSYRACLDLAAEVGTIRTVALCAVSTGVFGYPKDEAAPVALRTVADWLDGHPGRFDRVVFTVFADADETAYRRALGRLPPTRPAGARR
ncbi:O-acetyl-ADP-ribose deacetylase (regulator of RNase III) [Streptomyces sp. 3330]|uniref:macro domain-containing protein n=1 Tax=Streptomyces sp. 3330 TaxID=2817755 RepID=UPI00285AADF8|nr:macro domain-containing protein [Streptomyces sp. 3330]MDR6975267.1 O-acetyl-ADP-ribose deacetylase (regulator of RNase III) [Streptomyces sp. 3330]